MVIRSECVYVCVCVRARLLDFMHMWNDLCIFQVFKNKAGFWGFYSVLSLILTTPFSYLISTMFCSIGMLYAFIHLDNNDHCVPFPLSLFAYLYIYVLDKCCNYVF